MDDKLPVEVYLDLTRCEALLQSNNRLYIGIADWDGFCNFRQLVKLGLIAGRYREPIRTRVSGFPEYPYSINSLGWAILDYPRFYIKPVERPSK